MAFDHHSGDGEGGGPDNRHEPEFTKMLINATVFSVGASARINGQCEFCSVMAVAAALIFRAVSVEGAGRDLTAVRAHLHKVVDMAIDGATNP
jgi:hypothetical protein